MHNAGITGARGFMASGYALVGWLPLVGLHQLCPAAACSESPSSCRAWPGIHRLPSGCGHAALLPALGVLLLPDGCFAGTGQPGKGAGQFPARKKATIPSGQA